MPLSYDQGGFLLKGIEKLRHTPPSSMPQSPTSTLEPGAAAQVRRAALHAVPLTTPAIPSKIPLCDPCMHDAILDT